MRFARYDGMIYLTRDTLPDGSMVPWIDVWTTQRRKKGKEARQGDLGTIAQCVAGDVVACELADGSAIYLQIAWQWPDGWAAMVRLYDYETHEISLLSGRMATMRAEQRVRWLGVWAL